ncbi:NUDIX domain-containing protein [Leifsonia sp. AG29]|uniref:NUDIX domain-containing protein n=1 Tax=Leifsonia sp. AG29 TaxID=2598860 RepID=UPI00131C75D8|nr:NUDIX domain-containing protein [Leifsonia sp. AG29]
MTARSAGILLYRRRDDLEVWIAHMGGPFWARKQEGAWSIPKGLTEEGDGGDEVAAAVREFTEEIGTPPPDTGYTLLGEFRGSGKIIVAFAAEADSFEPETVTSNTFELDWPPGSGRTRTFPEVDDARWVRLQEARSLLTKAQRPILDALLAHLSPAE